MAKKRYLSASMVLFIAMFILVLPELTSTFSRSPSVEFLDDVQSLLLISPQLLAAQQEEEKEGEEEEEEPSGDEINDKISEEEKNVQEENAEKEVGEEDQKPDDKEEEKCGSDEYFNSKTNACILYEEKYCDDNKDNDRDGKVDSDDPDCPAKDEEELRSQHENDNNNNISNHPPKANAGQDKEVNEGEKVTLNGGESLDKDKDDKLSFSWEQSGPAEVGLDGANTASLGFTAPDVEQDSIVLKFVLIVTDSKGQEDKDTANVRVHNTFEGENKKEEENVQGGDINIDNDSDKDSNSDLTSLSQNTQNVINIDTNSTTANTNIIDPEPEQPQRQNISSVTKINVTNAAETNGSAIMTTEQSLIINCDPDGIKIVYGIEGTMDCDVENTTDKPMELRLKCAGLDGTGIECYFNGRHVAETILLNEKSDKQFSVVAIRSSNSLTPPGVYPFTINAECTFTRNSTTASC